MKKLEKLAPKLLSVVEQVQLAMAGWKNETNRYAILEKIDVIVNEPYLMDEMLDATSTALMDVPLEKMWPESSQVARTKYTPEINVLEVEFGGSGKVYEYFGVPYEKWVELVNCDSIGSFINKQIKGAFAYELQKIESSL